MMIAIFLERHAFRARFATTRCQKPPAEYAQKLVDFVMYVSRIRSKKNYTHIYAADETPIWLDPTLGKCIDFKGAKDVTVLSTGHEKSRITVMLTARSDGYKCIPYVLIPKKRWIYEAWQSLTEEMIASSFKTCGITNALDGSEDDLIHCFKQHGPASNG
uniref:Transposase n=1 Tax=Ditylenchus dipsaci TaxID=166011 RepID=A0A915DHN8_9BILA